MLTELHQKGGAVCRPAREGQLRCPLIVRPSSEDVITGHLVQALRLLNPSWWVPDLLNTALGSTRFRRQYYRDFRIEPWVNKPRYPRELLPWEEGSTQVDFCLTWENPPTTVYVEMKYGSDLSDRTTGNIGQYHFPADQLIRNIRIGLYECGYITSSELFPRLNRDFTVLFISPRGKHPLVERYRDHRHVCRSIPHSEALSALPRTPFIGSLSYVDVTEILKKQQHLFPATERRVIAQLVDYLRHKSATVPENVPPWSMKRGPSIAPYALPVISDACRKHPTDTPDRVATREAFVSEDRHRG